MFSMTKKNKLNTSILMACIISFAFVGMFYETAQASIKHLVVGGLLGAGAVLAWPTITGAVAAMAGGVMAAGTAVAGAVATGGALAGGAIAGTGAAVGGAVTAGFGAIGGAIAAITASPLFIPALIIGAVAITGYFVYKHFKNKAADPAAKAAENPFENAPATGRITDTAPAVSDNKNVTPATATPDFKNDAGVKPENQAVDQNSAAKSVKDKYTASYQNYIRLLQTDSSNGTSPEIMQAFQQLKQSQDEYRTYLDAHPEAASK